MNAFVNILKILIIILVIGVAGILILMGALVLFPGFNLFGLHYIKGSGQTSGTYIELNAEEEGNKLVQWNNASGVIIKTNGWDISVHPVTEASKNNYAPKTITSLWSHKYNGFVVGDVQEPSFAGGYFAQVGSDGKTYLIYEVKEPSGGWLSKVDTKLEIIYEPEMFDGKELKIETNSGSVVIGNSLELETRVGFEIGDLDITSASGDVTIRDVTINGEVNVDKNSGDFISQVDLTNNVNININGGFGSIDLKNVGSTDKSTSLVLNKISNSNIVFQNVYGDLVFEGTGGLVRGASVSGILSVNAGNCDFDISSVDGVVTFASTDGSLKLAEAKKSVIAQISGSGQVNLAKTYETVNISTKRGAVNLGEVCKDVKVITDGGKISIVGTSATTNYDVSSVNGEVLLDNIYGTVKFNTLSKGKSFVTINYKKLVGDNTINTQTGAINVNVPIATASNINDLRFLLSWETANDVDIKLQGGVSSTERKGENVSVNSASSTSTNLLKLMSVSGKIYAKSI